MGEDPAAATRLILEVGEGGRYAINREIVPADSLGLRASPRLPSGAQFPRWLDGGVMPRSRM